MVNESFAVGVDLGGTAIKYGICSSSGIIVEEFKRPTRADQPVEAILNDIAEAILSAIEVARGQRLTVRAVGMGTPGAVNVDTGQLMGNTPNFKHWKDVYIKRSLEARVNLPVWADNDANLMAYGELKYGAGKGAANVVCVTLGTGIGGGIIVDHRLFRGSRYAGSEIGHMSIDYNGRQCRCGGIGCWEIYGSASAMIEHYRRRMPESFIASTIDIFDAYERKEAAAVAVVEEEIRICAVGVANLINIFNPEKVIIGGGVSEAGDWFVARIEAAAINLAMKAATRDVKVVRARLGNKAGLLGAAAFALDQEERS